LLALCTGCIVYLSLLNPLSYASSGPYRFLTASLPAASSAAFCYLLLTRLLTPRCAHRRLLQRRGPE
jgi:NCS1 family nucleobase:cation symporter-1